MAGRVQLVIDPISREKVDIDLPIRFRVAPEEMRRQLSLPPHIDLSDATVAKAVGLVYAARSLDPALPIAFFGGVATRLLCPASNEASLGLRRSLHDLDLACLHRQLKLVRQFLNEVGDREGSALKIFETPGDRVFNSLGEGRRFRFHDLAAEEDRQIDLGTIDLVADEFRFCHRIGSAIGHRERPPRDVDALAGPAPLGQAPVHPAHPGGGRPEGPGSRPGPIRPPRGRDRA